MNTLAQARQRRRRSRKTGCEAANPGLGREASPKRQAIYNPHPELKLSPY